MVQASQLIAGMTIRVVKEPYRVESAVKVGGPKANPFMKCKLRHLLDNKVIEKNFRLNQDIEEVSMEERRIEYLYPEGKNHIFLDLGTLELVKVDGSIVGKKSHYLKEGVEVKGAGFGATIFSLELPQFLEIMVASVSEKGGVRTAKLETGAEIEVPPFIDVGDVVKIDTKTGDYIQRV